MNQYVSMDAEFGFIENHFTVMTRLNRLMVHIITRLNERYAKECGCYLIFPANLHESARK